MNPSLARAAASPARAVSLQQNKFDKTLVLHVLWLVLHVVKCAQAVCHSLQGPGKI